MVLALLTAPAVSFRPGPGLDASWQAALHMAANQGVAFGDRMVFTFGPLGFLSQPVVYLTWTGALAALYVAALQVALCVTLVSVLRRVVAVMPAVAVAFVAASASSALRAPELAAAVVTVVAISALRGDFSPRAERVLVVVGGLVAGSHLLVKANTGVTAMAVGAVTAWFVGRRGWRSEAVFGGAAAAALVAGWLLTGNQLADLGRFLALSADVVSGYSEAMGGEITERTGHHLLAVVVVLALVTLAWVCSRRMTRSRKVGLLLVGAVWLYGALKHGFVRHDFHDVFFFAGALLVATALAGAGRDWRIPGGGLAVLLVVFMVASDTGSVGLVDPLPALRALGTETLTFASADRRDRATRRARADLRRAYGLTTATVVLLEDRTVHIHPWEASVAWAYPTVQWRPLPVHQAYSAYTTGLDSFNAEFLSGPSAPERILTETRAIDSRNPDWESPRMVLAMLCHYRELAVQPRWQVLGRVEDRCGEEVPLGTVETRVGRPVPIPGTGGDMIVVARVRGLDDAPTYALRSTLLRIPEVHATLDGRRRHRLVPGTAAGGLVMSAPADTLGFSEPFAIDSASVLRIDHGGGWGLGTSLRIEFVGIPVLG